MKSERQCTTMYPAACIMVCFTASEKSSFKQGSAFPCQDHILRMHIWFRLSMTDINTRIMEFSYFVGVIEFNPGGTLNKLVLICKSMGICLIFTKYQADPHCLANQNRPDNRH